MRSLADSLEIHDTAPQPAGTPSPSPNTSPATNKMTLRMAAIIRQSAGACPGFRARAGCRSPGRG